MLEILLPFILSGETWDWSTAQKQLQNLYQSQAKCPKSCLGWLIDVVLSIKECRFYEKPNSEDFNKSLNLSLIF